MVFQEQHLSVAAQTNDLLAKTLAYGSLGRIHHALQNYAQAVMYLQEGRTENNPRIIDSIDCFSCVLMSSMMSTFNTFLLLYIGEAARCTKLRESFVFSVKSSASDMCEQMFDSH